LNIAVILDMNQKFTFLKLKECRHIQGR